MRLPTLSLAALVALAFLLAVVLPMLDTVRTAMEAGGAL